MSETYLSERSLLVLLQAIDASPRFNAEPGVRPCTDLELSKALDDLTQRVNEGFAQRESEQRG